MLGTPLTVGAALRLPQFRQLHQWMSSGARPLEIQDFIHFDPLVKDSERFVAEYRELLDGYPGKIGMHGPFLGLDLSNSDPEVCDIVRRRLLKALEVGAELGVTQMVVHSPFTYWHSLNEYSYGSIWPIIFRSIKSNLSESLDFASEIGCTIVLENVEDADPKLRVDLIDWIDHSALGASLDTGHASVANGKFGAPPVVDHLRAVARHLKHIHLQDADAHADRHWHPGDGLLPWRSIFAAVSELGSSPRLIVEVSSQFERLPSTVDYLSRLASVR